MDADDRKELCDAIRFFKGDYMSSARGKGDRRPLTKSILRFCKERPGVLEFDPPQLACTVPYSGGIPHSLVQLFYDGIDNFETRTVEAVLALYLKNPTCWDATIDNHSLIKDYIRKTGIAEDLSLFNMSVCTFESIFQVDRDLPRVTDDELENNTQS